MNPLTTFVRSMGNPGALANAQAALEARQREDWLVRGLAHRLDRQLPTPADAAPSTATHAAA